MQLESWFAFCSIAIIAAAIPGPAVLLIITHSLQFGALGSVFTIIGNVSGLLILSACSVLGLTALVKVSATGFIVIKIIGALYLLYLGIKLWRNGVKVSNSGINKTEKFNPKRLYSQGLFISLTNPKSIIFTSALFPQFIIISEPLLSQFIILVITLMMSSFMCLISYSVLSNKIKIYALGKEVGSKIGKIFGATFICASGALITSTQNRL
ncbi:LysE family translocator [Pseudoalteromonas denitrificans]|uniref:Threonine/homoserine/homoserine lactone efflux protein n=1 Tax=Pseudoalteromonas denitrificans DSM 6059 TaxID=1123010 RepID=A0A1I1UA18_9GAMM|nr:LysE family transporter [Pseudoalteromonas denitrificans]SFD65603.1 Threonine/homoserine/homoserine lactone efflux protein [Pseudoalteromonas denitrificans DSM 6059]